MLEINGSIGEGGGQVLRTALTLSCVLQKPVRISNIRAGRSSPGLKAQHLAVCSLLAKMCGARLSGAAIGSTTVEFEPSGIAHGEYEFDIGTAGSCALLLQSALPVMLFSRGKSSLRIRGGTHVRGAPTYEYFSMAFLPAIAKFKAKCSARLLRAGFYPKGGGEILLEVEPSRLAGFAFEPQKEGEVNCSIISSGLPPHVAKREEEEVQKIFAGSELGFDVHEADSLCPGNAVSVWRGFCGGCAIGEKGVSAEKVAIDAAAPLKIALEKGACVDERMADQLLIYAALADGRSSFSTTSFSSHFMTNCEVIRAMTGRNIILGADNFAEVI